MTAARSEPAQQPPPPQEVLLARLRRAAPPARLFREHAHRAEAADGGCWWFSSTGEGRFDLQPPQGTCYLGESEGVAARERCGRLMAMGIPITEALYAGRIVTQVPSLQADVEAADLTDPSSLRAGVTGELASTSDYALCQE